MNKIQELIKLADEVAKGQFDQAQSDAILRLISALTTMNWEREMKPIFAAIANVRRADDASNV